MQSRLVSVLLATAIVLIGCTTQQQGQAEGTQRPAQLKRIKAAIMEEQTSIRDTRDELELLVNSGLAHPDREGGLRPILAEAVPSLENGLWQLLPDGRMQTTWTIRPDVVWHDGVPFTTEDLLFATRVDQDPELDLFGKTPYKHVESIEAPDARTITVRWKQPYVFADHMFTFAFGEAGFPMPKHILEPVYLANKRTLLALPYWTTEHVGTGPFKLREWVDNSHVLLEGNDRFVYGRPKVDLIEIKFIPDSNGLVASIMAGEVELVLGRNISVEQAIVLRENWRDGTVHMGAFNHIMAMYPQLVNPEPAALTDVGFRRALLHAVDRQAMSDLLFRGILPVAHGFFPPNAPTLKEAADRAVRYEYDPRRASQLLEEMGFRQGSEGMVRDPAGQPLASLEIRASTARDMDQKLALAVIDSWKAVGVPAHTIVPVRGAPRGYQATRPAFELTRRSAELDRLDRYFGPPLATAENNFAGSQLGRDGSPRFYALLDRYFTAVPRPDRLKAAGDIIHYMTDAVFLIPLIHDTEPHPISRRLNVLPRGLGENSGVVDAEQWDVVQ